MKQTDYSLLPQLLLPWYDENKRELPWRESRDPYRVWVSEIMLQQTRVEAVQEAYRRFLEALPSVEALASCSDDRLKKLWEGLGYYSRVRNMKKAAELISANGGKFPHEVTQLRRLPGIGEYTAGAIASICFEQPTAAVDGNVLRVLTRLEASRADVTSPKVRREFAQRLEQVYPAGRCGDFTQSIMELGATVCLPNGAPRCRDCPLAEICLAMREDLWKEIPCKPAKKPRKNEQLTVFVLRCGGKIALRQRSEDTLLAGMWELPNLRGILSESEAAETAKRWGCGASTVMAVCEKRHVFTHLEWEMRGVLVECEQPAKGMQWFDPESLRSEISVPTAFRKFLQGDFCNV